MPRVGIPAVSLLVMFGLTAGAAADPPTLVSCDDPPAAVLALGAKSDIEAYGLATAASVSVAAMGGHGDGAGSMLRFTRGTGAARDVKLAGQVVGLAVTPDGAQAFAIVRVRTRKGEVRSVELARVDLVSARVAVGPTIPATSRGLAIGSNGSTLLVASRDEIRTFQLPGLASGPLYRALGENVGVAPIAGSSCVLLAQPSRLVVADLSGSQGRDGLVLSQETAAPAPLRGMLASAGDSGPVALSDGGLAWCVSAVAPPPKDPPIPPVAPPPPPPVLAPVLPPVQSPPVEPTPVPAPVAEPEMTPPPAERDAPAVDERAIPVVSPATGTPVAPGTVRGVVAGPAVSEVAAIVLLGPDNVLREAARVVPDQNGRFLASALAPGAYRAVAAGKGGRVLICEPPFITIRVDSNGAVEAPVLKVLHAQ